MNVKLDAPKYNVTSGGFHVIGHVTVSGQYRLQLALEPFLVPLGGSPFLVDIAAGEPVIPHTLLIKHPETVTIDAFGQFFFQPRDLYLNFVTSRHRRIRNKGDKIPPKHSRKCNKVRLNCAYDPEIGTGKFSGTRNPLVVSELDDF